MFRGMVAFTPAGGTALLLRAGLDRSKGIVREGELLEAVDGEGESKARDVLETMAATGEIDRFRVGDYTMLKVRDEFQPPSEVPDWVAYRLSRTGHRYQFCRA